MIPLQVRELYKDYRKDDGSTLAAVRGVSFEVRAGECFGLLGPNGAGKSTIIHCISGFYPPTRGEVLIEGHSAFNEPKKARQALGVCPQVDTLDTDFNVFDQMVMHARYFGVPQAEARERTRALLGMFRLLEKSRDPVESLSGGMRRRIQVARALVSNPRVLVLDEPTTGLDPDVRRTLWDILMECRSRGLAILLSTHYMEEAERLCDRVAVLSRGRILDVAEPSELIRKHVREGEIQEEIRPGVIWKRAPNLEDVYMRLAGSGLESGQEALQ